MCGQGLLSASDCERYHGDGYHGPFTVMDPGPMAVIRQELEQDLALHDEAGVLKRAQARHLDLPALLRLACNAEIVGRVRSLLGEDLVLMQSNFFIKYPGGGEVPWHQDLNYWNVEPPVVVSCWLALDDVDIDNACVDIIPGSHKHYLRHVPASQGQEFREQADPDSFNAAERVRMRLQAGQAFLFTERLLHHSDANPCRRRMGLALRYTIPQVRVGYKQAMVLVSGQDSFGFNEVVTAAALQDSLQETLR